MKKKHHIWKEAGVLLITTIMIFSTIVVTADTRKQMDISHIKSDSMNPCIRTNVQTPIGSVIFDQRPFEPDEQWTFRTSASDPGYVVYDNFWGLKESICDIHWWGLTLIYGIEWENCDPEGMKFEIIFYGEGSTPGNPVCTYSDISPTIIDTGKEYGAGLLKMYYFETDLDPCCNLTAGWVSIQSTSSPNDCWLLWAGSPEGDKLCYQNNEPILDGDCAFELTGPAKAFICCDGENLDWRDVVPGDTVKGKIHVCNCGDPGTFLNFQVDSWPPWGTNWSFNPPSGVGIATGDCVIIDVSVDAPMVENKNYGGEIKIINTDNPDDFCEVGTTLRTPKNAPFFSLPLLSWLFEKFPNALPILRYMLGF